MKTIELDGNNFDDVDSFYDEVQRKLCPGFAGFGRNINAFIDVLRGGFGVHEYGEPIQVNWLESAKSRKDMGYKATLAHIKDLRKQAHPSNLPDLDTWLADVENEKGDTLFDILVDALRHNEAGHKDVQLVLK